MMYFSLALFFFVLFGLNGLFLGRYVMGYETGPEVLNDFIQSMDKFETIDAGNILILNLISLPIINLVSLTALMVWFLCFQLKKTHERNKAKRLRKGK